MAIEALAQRLALGLCGAGFGEHDEVASGERCLQAERLAREPLQAVTVHCVLRDASRDRETEPRDVGAARACEHGEIAIARADGLAEYTAEVLRGVKTLAG